MERQAALKLVRGVVLKPLGEKRLVLFAPVATLHVIIRQ